MSDPFSSYSRGLESPASKHLLVTPDDGVDLATRPRFLIVGGVGNLAIMTAGVAIVYENVQGVFPVSAQRVLATGTTATNIVACW